jgi:hypothetical protein
MLWQIRDRLPVRGRRRFRHGQPRSRDRHVAAEPARAPGIGNQKSETRNQKSTRTFLPSAFCLLLFAFCFTCTAVLRRTTLIVTLLLAFHVRAECKGKGEFPLAMPSTIAPEALAKYESDVLAWLNKRAYVTELSWCGDKGIRDTGPWINDIYYGTQGRARLLLLAEGHDVAAGESRRRDPRRRDDHQEGSPRPPRDGRARSRPSPTGRS